MAGTSGARPRLILGSASPRRLELLAQLGVTPHDVRPPDVDETPLPGELPRAYCARVSRAKANAVQAENTDIVLCADTTVALGRRILGKPADESDVRAALKLLSGRRHKVITAVTIRLASKIWTRDVVSSVRLKVLNDAELDWYIGTGDWQGKAGSYGIQGPASAFIPWIQGSYSGIVGLPLAETGALLHAAGLRWST